MVEPIINLVFKTFDTLISSAAGIDKVEVIDEGDKIKKVYMIRRFKGPWCIEKFILYLREAIIPPLRDPRRIKIDYYTKGEEGVFTEHDIIVVTVPKTTPLTKQILSQVRKIVSGDENVTVGEGIQRRLFGKTIGLLSSPYKESYKE